MSQSKLLQSYLLAVLALGVLGCPGAADEGLDASSPSLSDASSPGGADGSSSADAFVAPDALRITSASTLLGTLEQPIDLALTAEGGEPAYSWSLAPSSLLPVGFSLSSDGVLRGIPHTSGRYPFGVAVSDAAGRTASATLELVVAEPILNEACRAATALDLYSGATTVLGTLESARPDGASAACQVASVPDLFYSFELTAPSKVTATLARGDNAVVALFRAGCPGEVEPLACNASIRSTYPAGQYVVAVAGEAGAFQLDLAVAALSGDSCDDLIPLDLSSGSALISGTFRGAKADFASSCHSGTDRVYAFELAADADIRVQTTSWFVSKSLRSGTCPGTAEIDCTDDDGDLVVLNAKAGQYLLVLTNYYDSTDAFAVTLTTSPPSLPPANDTCAAATELTLVNDTAVMSGRLLGATYDPVFSSCGGTQTDVYFALDLTSPSTLTVKAVQSNLGIAVHLLSGTCGQLAPFDCTSYGEGLCQSGLPAGRYYLRVSDSPYSSSQASTFSYFVTRQDSLVAPANDTCSAPQALTLKSGSAVLSGKLAAAAQDYTLPCLTSSSTGLHDLVYELTLATRSDVTVSSGYGLYTSLAAGVVGSDCETGNFVGCTSSSSAYPLKLWGLAPGTYWIVVEGYSSSSQQCWEGDFTATVTATASPEAPANDSCSAPTEYVFTGPGIATMISGTTRGAADDFTGKVSCRSEALAGPDVVYALTLQSSATLRVSSSTPIDAMTFYLTSRCGSTSTLACSSTNYSSQQFTTGVLPAGTYYLVVDSGDYYSTGLAFDFDLIVDTL